MHGPVRVKLRHVTHLEIRLRRCTRVQLHHNLGRSFSFISHKDICILSGHYIQCIEAAKSHVSALQMISKNKAPLPWTTVLLLLAFSVSGEFLSHETVIPGCA